MTSATRSAACCDEAGDVRAQASAATQSQKGKARKKVAFAFPPQRLSRFRQSDGFRSATEINRSRPAIRPSPRRAPDCIRGAGSDSYNDTSIMERAKANGPGDGASRGQDLNMARKRVQPSAGGASGP